MTSAVALDDVTSIYASKRFQMQVNVHVCDTVQLLVDFFSSMAKSRKKLEALNVFPWFILFLNRKRWALVRDRLLSNNSLFVGQLRTRDLVSFTTVIQTVNYYTTIHF